MSYGLDEEWGQEARGTYYHLNWIIGDERYSPCKWKKRKRLKKGVDNFSV